MGGLGRQAIRLRVLSAGSYRLCRDARCGDCRGPDPAVSRLTRNAVQLRKHFYQATRLVAGLLVVVLAMTGAAKLARSDRDLARVCGMATVYDCRCLAFLGPAA